jgi:hypothetical protein
LNWRANALAVPLPLTKLPGMKLPHVERPEMYLLGKQLPPDVHSTAALLAFNNCILGLPSIRTGQPTACLG